MKYVKEISNGCYEDPNIYYYKVDDTSPDGKFYVLRKGEWLEVNYSKYFQYKEKSTFGHWYTEELTKEQLFVELL